MNEGTRNVWGLGARGDAKSGGGGAAWTDPEPLRSKGARLPLVEAALAGEPKQELLILADAADHRHPPGGAARGSLRRSLRAAAELLRVLALPSVLLMIVGSLQAILLGEVLLRDWRTPWVSAIADAGSDAPAPPPPPPPPPASVVPAPSSLSPPSPPPSSSGVDDEADSPQFWTFAVMSVFAAVSIVVWTIALVAWFTFGSGGNTPDGHGTVRFRGRWLALKTVLASLFQGGLGTLWLWLLASSQISPVTYRLLAGAANLVLAIVLSFIMFPAGTADQWKLAISVGVMALGIGLYFSVALTFFFASDSAVFRLFFRLFLHPGIWTGVAYVARITARRSEAVPDGAKATIATTAQLGESLFGRLMIATTGTVGSSVATAAAVAVGHFASSVFLVHQRDRVAERLRSRPEDDLVGKVTRRGVTPFRHDRLYADSYNASLVTEMAEIVVISVALFSFGYDPSQPSWPREQVQTAGFVADLGILVASQLAFTLISSYASVAYLTYHGYAFLEAFASRNRGWLRFTVATTCIALNFLFVVVFSRTAENVGDAERVDNPLTNNPNLTSAR